jgi:hypothetical protein
MSLINDALKKAQQLQQQGSAAPPPASGPPPPAPAPGIVSPPSVPLNRPAGRDKPLPGQIFVLLALGAGVVIALSVLATVYLLRPPAPPAVAQAPTPSTVLDKPAPAPVAKSNAPSPPETTPPAPAEIPSHASAATAEKVPAPAGPASTPAVVVASINQSSPTVAPPLPSASSFSNSPAVPVLRSFGEGGGLSNSLDPTKPDPKILAFIDALQVAGVRVTDTGSKVLMNDRVYRENEIVDHLLGLRLKKIAEDVLTFVDERGIVYTKNL